MSTQRFASTEAGLRLLTVTLRTYRHSNSALVQVRGRISQTALGPTDHREVARQSALLRLVSVTEAATDSLSGELSDRDLDRPIPVVIERLVLEKELAGTSSWPGRESMYKRHHGIDLSKCAEYKRVKGAVSARNSIAHALGRQTTRQQLSGAFRADMARLGVPIVNGRIHLRDSNLDECASYCRAFLRDLDQRA